MLGSSALVASLLLPRSAPAAAAATDPRSWTDEAYWAFADRLQDPLDRQWDAGAGVYLPAAARRCRRAARAARRRRAARVHAQEDVLQHVVRIVPGGVEQARRLTVQRGTVALVYDRERVLVARGEAGQERAVR